MNVKVLNMNMKVLSLVEACKSCSRHASKTSGEVRRECWGRGERG